MKHFVSLFVILMLLVYIVSLWDYIGKLTPTDGLKPVVMCIWEGEETCKAILEKPDENL